MGIIKKKEKKGKESTLSQKHVTFMQFRMKKFLLKLFLKLSFLLMQLTCLQYRNKIYCRNKLNNKRKEKLGLTRRKWGKVKKKKKLSKEVE